MLRTLLLGSLSDQPSSALAEMFHVNLLALEVNFLSLILYRFLPVSYLPSSLHVCILNPAVPQPTFSLESLT